MAAPPSSAEGDIGLGPRRRQGVPLARGRGRARRGPPENRRGWGRANSPDAVWPDGPAAGASGRGQPRPGGAAVSLVAKVRSAGQGASAAVQPCVTFATQRGGESTPAGGVPARPASSTSTSGSSSSAADARAGKVKFRGFTQTRKLTQQFGCKFL